MRDRVGKTGLFVLVIAAGFASDLKAQDVEVAAAVMGRPVPQAYYDRLSLGQVFEIQRGWRDRSALSAVGGPAVGGVFPVLVVPVAFADSQDPPVPSSEIQRVLFDGPSEAGTLTEYYAEASGGRLIVQGVVTSWVRSSLTVAEVRGSEFGLGSDARVGELLVEALEAVDDEVDFRAFDNDGPDGVPDSGDDDGVVDALAVEFLEAPLTCAGQGPTIWGHRWVVAGWNGVPYESDDVGVDGRRIVANDYITQAAVRCTGQVQTTVVIAHEFGHILGMPDLYDSTEGRFASQRNWVLGCWSIMAAGQWGCGPALAQGRWDRPTHFSPWERDRLGWTGDRQVADGVLDVEYVLRPAETTGDLLEIPLSDTERLQVEYRDGSGFDRNLPGTGVLVYHVDDKRPLSKLRCRSCERIYRVGLLEADGNRSLLIPEGEGGSRGQTGDIFRSGGRILGTTDPSTRLSSGAASDVSIYSIVIADGVARVRVSSRVIELETLLSTFLQSEEPGPDAVEREYLDRVGNGDGEYDLGDFRRYFLDHPSVLARGRGGP